MNIAEAFAKGMQDEAPNTERKLAEYRRSEAFRSLSLHEQKQIGLLHLFVTQIAEHKPMTR